MVQGLDKKGLEARRPAGASCGDLSRSGCQTEVRGWG